MIVIDDYWSPGKIIDVYGKILKPKDLKYIEELPTTESASVDSMDNVDDRAGFVNTHMLTDEINTVDFNNNVLENLTTYDKNQIIIYFFFFIII